MKAAHRLFGQYDRGSGAPGIWLVGDHKPYPSLTDPLKIFEKPGVLTIKLCNWERARDCSKRSKTVSRAVK
eukprot:COSAG02_NODE_904_length_16045_cov_3920.854697_2_plen_71_part_00